MKLVIMLHVNQVLLKHAQTCAMCNIANTRCLISLANDSNSMALVSEGVFTPAGCFLWSKSVYVFVNLKLFLVVWL